MTNPVQHRYKAPNPITDARVAMLYGGWSDERDISKASAQACHAALIEAGFNSVTDLDVADKSFVTDLAQGKYDVAFIAMHGAYGEDGAIQGLLEILHIPYTFSGVAGASLAIHKDKAKVLYQAAGLNVAPGICIRYDEIAACVDDSDIQNTLVPRIASEVALPFFIKPCVNGSSFGVSLVKNVQDIPQALRQASQHTSDVLIEEAIEGTEVTAPVIGNQDAQALPLIQIITGDAEFYDNTVKYEPPEDHHILPAKLPQAVYERVQADAIKARKAVGCLGASRSDFIVKDDGTPVILETNVIPGMTQTSLLPDAAAYAGIAFPQLCRLFVELAFSKDTE